MVNTINKAKIPTGTSPSTVRQAGKIKRRLPNANVKTGKIAGKLKEMPGTTRQRVVNQFDRLDSSTKSHFDAVDQQYNPASEATDLFENTGPSGRRALNDLTDSNPDAADVLIRMDDAATQRRFTRAYESDSVDSDELATALRRYDELDANEKRTADAMVARDGDDAVSLLDETVCNSPCKSFTKTWHDLKQTDAVTPNDATTFRNKLLDAKRRGTISDDRAADMLGDTKKLANEDGIDATDVISRDNVFSRKVIQRYADSDSAGPDTLRKMDELGEVDLPDTQIERKYKHADDFGVSGNKNPENKERFKEAIAEHAVDPDTEVIEGEYNRLEGDQSVTHIYNSRTGNNVIVNDGEFLTGFKLNSGQRTNIENDGVIGGS